MSPRKIHEGDFWIGSPYQEISPPAVVGGSRARG